VTLLSERMLCFSKYGAVFIGAHDGLHRALRRHLRLRLNLNLDLDLNLDLNLGLNLSLYLNLNLFLIPKPFSSLSAALTLGFWLLTFDLCRLPLLPPRRPVGRPLPGRIVVRDRRTTTYGWRSVPWTAAAELPLFRKIAVLQCALRGTDRACARDRPRVVALAPEQRRSFRRSVPN